MTDVCYESPAARKEWQEEQTAAQSDAAAGAGTGGWRTAAQDDLTHSPCVCSLAKHVTCWPADLCLHHGCKCSASTAIRVLTEWKAGIEAFQQSKPADDQEEEDDVLQADDDAEELSSEQRPQQGGRQRGLPDLQHYSVLEGCLEFITAALTTAQVKQKPGRKARQQSAAQQAQASAEQGSDVAAPDGVPDTAGG